MFVRVMNVCDVDIASCVINISEVTIMVLYISLVRSCCQFNNIIKQSPCVLRNTCDEAKMRLQLFCLRVCICNSTSFLYFIMCVMLI